MSIPTSRDDPRFSVKTRVALKLPSIRNQLGLRTMSTLKDASTTPTTSKEYIRKADSYVFSSPARDVGWSPGAANTPLDVLSCGNKSNSTHVNHILSHLSPIRRSSRFPLSDADMDISEITALPHYNPPVETEATEVDLTSKKVHHNHHGYEPSKEARASKLLPPPSTPQPLGALFQSPIAEYSVDYYMGYPYDDKRKNDKNQSPSEDNSPQIGVRETDESDIHKTGIPFTCSSSPISPPCYTISDSPVKPRRVPTFPPPASPIQFTSYPSSYQHTYADRRLKRTFPRSGVPSPPSLCYPSAEPLDDDPFLVSAVTVTNDRVFGESTLRHKPDLLDPLGSTEVMHSIRAVPSSVRNHSIQANNLSRRSRIPQGRTSTLGDRTGRANNPMSKSRVAFLQRRGVVPNLLSAISPSPHAPAQSSSLSFSDPYKPEPQSGSWTSTLDYVRSDEYADPSTPSTQLEIASISYVNPISTAGTLFPTPSLTSSFGTPSTASIVQTPGHPTLFPSPDITTSPTIIRSTRSRNKLAYGRLMSRFTTLTPRAEPDLMGEGELAELTPEYHNVHYTPVKTRANHNAESQESDMSGPDKDNAPIQTSTSPAGSVSEDAGPHANPELFQSLSSDSFVDQPLVAPNPVEYEEQAQTSFNRSTQKIPTQPIFDQLSKSAGDLVNKYPQSKRAREENDTAWTPIITKRVKMLDKHNTSPSPTREVSPQQISDFLGLGRATRSQTRAATTLLALSSGDGSGSKCGPISDIGRQEHPDENIPETKTLITRRTSTRSKRQPQPVIGHRYEISTKPQRTKQGIVGRAPSRAVDVPSSNTVKTQSSASIHPKAPKRNGVKQKQIRGSQSNDIPQTYDGDIEAGNVDQNQGANHVPTSNEEPKVPSELLPRPHPSVTHGPDGNVARRTFPDDLPIHESYPKWYRRNPVSAYFRDGDPARNFIYGENAVSVEVANPISRLVFNAAPHFSLYTPRFIHGVGVKKVGLCPICVEPVWRGGEGRHEVLNTKISRYNYHMQYYHGISPKTGLPFSPPIAFREINRKKSEIKPLEREVVEQGKCHVCQKWITIESLKLIDIMVPERPWWQHAASCHGINRLDGDKDPYIEDNVYLRLREYEARLERNTGRTEKSRLKDGAIQDSDAYTLVAGPEDGVISATQTDEMIASGNSSIKQEINEDIHEQRLFIDWDSDLTDLDEEAEVAGMDTSDDGP